MFTLLGRLFMIVIGYIAAASAASAVVVMAVQGLPRGDIEVATGVIYGLAIIGGAFYALFLMAPAFIVIAIAEAFRLRSWWFYVLMGLGGALLIDSNWWTYVRTGDLTIWRFVDDALHLFNINPTGSIQEFFDETKAMPVLLSAGAAAGLVYWLIAGRRAGFGSRIELSR